MDKKVVHQEALKVRVCLCVCFFFFAAARSHTITLSSSILLLFTNAVCLDISCVHLSRCLGDGDAGKENVCIVALVVDISYFEVCDYVCVDLCM